jgi:sugar phosphate isomerase/epimerase
MKINRMISRKKFIQQAGLLSAGVLLSKSIFAGAGKTDKFGLQLWTVKEEMAEDPSATLTKLAGFGYTSLESFEGDQGIFWGKSNKEFKKFVGGLGMKLVSSHCKIEENFERKAGLAAEIGMKYLVCPMNGAQKNIEDFKRFAEEFNACGEVCRKNGLRFAYHNHDYSFKELDNEIPQDVMMNLTDQALVDFEMDIYWTITAGVNPLKYMQKYPGRFKMVHIKDRSKNVPIAAQWESCNLGEGIIDYKAILPQIKKEGIQYMFVEQEKFTGSTPLISSGKNAGYMKRILK